MELVTIPEQSPWWGGFWKRLVRSVKSALRRCIGRATLSFEDFRTLIPEIEAEMNRRPITYLSDNRDDLRHLRPVYFLLTPGPSPLDGVPQSQALTARWRYRVAVFKCVYSHWEREYLAELHCWTRVPQGRGSPRVGDVVIRWWIPLT